MSTLIYDRDGIQLYLGLSEQLDMLEDESVDLSVFSPPYNIKTGNGSTWNTNDWYEDDLPQEEYEKLQVTVLNEVWRVTKSNRSLFYNTKVRQKNKSAIHPLRWIFRSKWNLRQQIIWDRGSTHQKNKFYFWDETELIFWLQKGTATINTECAKMTTIWQFPFETNSPHPAPFPEELPTRCILACSKPGDLVLDPYIGSGTTAKACQKSGRRCIGVDREEKYLREMAIPGLAQGIML